MTTAPTHPTARGAAMRPPIGYRALTTALTPLVAALSLYQGMRAGDRRCVTQRLGHGPPLKGARPIWLHAASVGEVQAARPLVEALATAFPGVPLLVTTVTTTGAELVRRVPLAGLSHRYLPWDSRGAVARFLRKTRPRCALIMETEIWPHLYGACAQRSIPLLIVNGRLSQKTLAAGRWLRRLHTGALACCDTILARSANDAAGFRSLGAPDGSVITLGNIKFAPPPPAATTEPEPLPFPYLLAASTHDDEEVRLARLWLTEPRAVRLLVIAPRHPQRVAAILAALEPLTDAVAVRSRGELPGPDTRVYLADTLGEMGWLMRHAEAVFMGGSLIARGGHNVLEPAHLGKAILTGPHVENFREECAALAAAGALIQVPDDETLATALTGVLADPQRRRQLEQRALAAVAPYAHIVDRYIEAIRPYCVEPPAA